MNKTLIWIIVIVVVVLGGYFLVNKQKPVSGEPIKIGVAAAQTGTADEWGQGELRAVQLLVDKVNKEGGVNGRQIKLVVEDTKSDNVGTVNAVKKLVEIDNVQVIIGPTWADSFAGGNPIAESNKVVLLSPSTAIEVAEEKEDFDYFFSTWWPQEQEVIDLQKFMKDSGAKTIVIINDRDAFTMKIAEFFINNADNNDIKVVEHYEVPIGEKDFRTTIAKTKQLNPDGIFLETQDPGQFGPFMKQVKELGLKAKVFSTTYVQNEKLLKDYGMVLDGMVYSYPKAVIDDAYNKFVEEYKEKYNSEPSSPSVVNAHNATLALLEVLKKGVDTGEEIKDGLYKIRVKGVGISEVGFNEMGQIDKAVFEIKTIKNGKFELVK